MTRPLTDNETLILRAFQRQVNRLRQSSIVQSGRVNFRYTTNIDFQSGEIDTAFKGYDEIAFQAQLPILRQFLLQQDSIGFYRIHDILNQCCDRQELVEWVRFVRRRWVEILTRLPIDDHRFFHGANENVDKAVEKLFYGYGGLFHINPDDPEEEAKVQEIQAATLQNAFPHFWMCLNTVDSVILWWLDAPTDPVPELPSDEGSS